jgi:four helix bundle protein
MKVEDMDVFQMSHSMTLEIYRLTDTYPASEKFGLTSQMRRAGSSVCMNLMEGAHRISKKEYKHFIGISRGSCGEVKYQVLLSRDLGYISENTYLKLKDLLERISMMLTKLHRAIG